MYLVSLHWTRTFDWCLLKQHNKGPVNRADPQVGRIPDRTSEPVSQLSSDSNLAGELCLTLIAHERKILTEDSQPVVDRYDNHIPIAGQDTAVKHIPSSFHIRAPMDENHHRLGTSTLPNICGGRERGGEGGGEGRRTD